MSFTFQKSERLSSKRQIDKLFAQGNSFFQFPFKVIFLKNEPSDDPIPAQLLISVSKRNFKNAPDRNKIKRLTREAYRRNKQQLYTGLSRDGSTLLVAFIYTAKTILKAEEVERKIILILQRLIKGNAETTG